MLSSKMSGLALSRLAAQEALSLFGIRKNQSVDTLKAYFGEDEASSPQNPFYSHMPRWRTGAWGMSFLNPDYVIRSLRLIEILCHVPYSKSHLL